MSIVEADLTRTGTILALTQCASCPRTIPQNFAITARYMGDTEHFCSNECRERHEEHLNEVALERLRGAGL